MNKYKVYLADNYPKGEVFTTDWDYELLGDNLRAEFDHYFAEQEELAGAGVGKSKRLLKSDFIKRFMISKKVNLVDDPSNGSLKSVFVLRPGEEKIIDQRAKENLALRFEYRVLESSLGKKSQPMGFMKFELVEGSEKDPYAKDDTLQITGNDIQYFQEEAVVETFSCEECGKTFETKKALQAHSLSHNKK